MSLRDNLEQPAAGALRVLAAVVIGPGGTVGEAIELMREHHVGCVVVTEHSKPVGIISERDVLTKVIAKSLPLNTMISTVMSSPPETIGEDCSIASLIRQMHRGGFRHVPVVDGADRLSGVLSVKRVVEYLVEHFPSAVFNLPPDSVQQQISREGA